MVIYNSLSGKKEEFIKSQGPIRMFVCGPTVYNYIHIGNARTYLTFDTIARYLRTRKIKLFYLQNITDIDDKIIGRAKEENKTPKAIAEFYYKAYLKNMRELHIKSVDKYAKATSYIPQIITQVKTLIAKGYGYEISCDGIYFNIAKFKNYGKLSHRTALQAEDATSRIDEGVKKINKGDFCLWKFSRANEPFWKTNLGNGRPGWHIEDTAISEKYFGTQYEIHGGGIDLKFPHHEAEIAQQEAASGKTPFVKYWMHTGFLHANNQKMSKSLGNFITVNDFLKKYDANVLRMISLTHHYRSPINFSATLAKSNEEALVTLREFYNKLRVAIHKNKSKKFTLRVDLPTVLARVKEKFFEAMDDDFNTLQAAAIIFELVSKLQGDIWRLRRIDALTLKKFLNVVWDVFGIEFKEVKIPKSILQLSAKRELLRDSKQFVRADTLRKKIRELGYEVEDTPYGSWLKPI